MIFNEIKCQVNIFSGLVGGCTPLCPSTVLTAACYWPSGHCITAQKFVSVSGES